MISMADVFDDTEYTGIKAFHSLTPEQRAEENRKRTEQREYEALHTPVETDAERNDPDEYPPEDDE